MREGFHILGKVHIQDPVSKLRRTHTDSKDWDGFIEAVEVPEGRRAELEDMKADNEVIEKAMKGMFNAYLEAIKKGWHVISVDSCIRIRDEEEPKGDLTITVEYQRRWTSMERIKNWWNRLLESKKAMVKA